MRGRRRLHVVTGPGLVRETRNVSWTAVLNAIQALKFEECWACRLMGPTVEGDEEEEEEETEG